MASNFWPSPSPIAHISLYHHFFFCLVCFVLFFYGGKTVCRVAWRLCKNQKRFFSLPCTQLSSQLQLSAETNWTRVQSKWAHTVRTEETFTYTSLTKSKKHALRLKWLCRPFSHHAPWHSCSPQPQACGAAGPPAQGQGQPPWQRPAPTTRMGLACMETSPTQNNVFPLCWFLNRDSFDQEVMWSNSR